MEPELLTNQKPKRRGRKPTSKAYFEEQEMVNILKEYRRTKDPILYNQLYNGFNKIISGMINTCYNYNSAITDTYNENGHIKKTYDTARAECLYNITKSLHLYNPDKGRLFGYLNRVVKNSLTQLSNKKSKIFNNELTYSGIWNDDVNEDYNSTNEENVDNIYQNQNGIKIDNEDNYGIDYLSETNVCPINPLPIKKSLSVKSSLYVIYKYVSYLYGCVNYFVVNDKDRLNMIENIKYDTKVNFDFENVPILNDERLYLEIITNLNMALENIKNYLEQTYPEEIKTKPDDYYGQLSNRSLGYIRKRFKTSIQKQFNTDYYGGVDELIKFINYLVLKKEEDYSNG